MAARNGATEERKSSAEIETSYFCSRVDIMASQGLHSMEWNGPDATG